MDPTLLYAAGGLAILGIIGMGLMAWLLGRKRQPRKASARAERPRDSAAVAADPQLLELGANLYLGGLNHSLKILALDHHFLTDEEHEPVQDGEDWWTITLQDNMQPERRVHLSCARDDEGIWRWSIHEQLTERDLRRIEGLLGVSFDGDDKAPPLELEYLGARWVTDEDSHDYEVFVRSRHLERADEDSYLTMVTDYYETDAWGEAKGARELSLELWARRQGLGAGRCLTMGRPYEDEVRMFVEEKGA